LNPNKYGFKVNDGKFFRFMLTHKGIEANLDKYKALVEIRRANN